MNKIIQGDCLIKLKELEDNSVDCLVTSPPYWALRDYGMAGQLGLESTFQEYITKLCDIFDEVKRVLKDEGTCWVNIGDTYNSHSTGNGAVGGIEGNRKNKQDNRANTKKDYGQIQDKCLCCIPDRFKIEMINRGWICRNEIIWFKPNCMPSSVKDRFTVDYEKVFFFVKQKKYFFKTQYEKLAESSLKDPRLDKGREEHIGKSATKNYGCNATFINSQGRNKRCVWQVKDRPTPYSIIEPEFRKEIIDFRDLPNHNAIREYLTEWKNKKGLTIEQIENYFGNQAGHHWFEKEGSYPSKEDWIKLKELLRFDNTFDECMTTIFQKSGLKQNSPEGRIKRTVWQVTTKPFKEAHFATYPEKLIEPMIDAGCHVGGIVLDPFFGAGTTGVVAKKQGKNYIGIELNAEYIKIAEARINAIEIQTKLEVKSGSDANDDGIPILPTIL